jgi:ubiquinone/menaquinone biosynthesis C-methylase UbiE
VRRIPSSWYDGIYYRKLTSGAILDEIDERIVGDPGLAGLRCTIALSRTDLTRYASFIRGSITSRLTPTRRPILLDHGCGLGGLGRWLSEELEASVVGLDYSVVALAQAGQALTGGQHQRVCLLAAEFSALPLRDGCIDGAISLDALYLAHDRERALSELHRLLRPRSPFIFTGYLEVGGREAARDKPESWSKALVANGFLTVSVEDVTDRWRSVMKQRHRSRWKKRSSIAQQLGTEGIAELSVSAAMLGVSGTPGVIDRTCRFEILCIRE